MMLRQDHCQRDGGAAGAFTKSNADVGVPPSQPPRLRSLIRIVTTM